MREQARQAVWLSIIGNLSIATLKWLVGYFGNSFALIADAIESTTDIFSSLLVFFGLSYATKPADSRHPYGHGKAEALFTFVVVAFLVFSALLIGYQSVRNIFTPHPAPEPYTLVVLFFIIFFKEFFYRLISKKNSALQSSAIKADAWHHRSDALTSLAAFIGIAIAVIFGKGYESADDFAALVASFVILYNAYLIFRPALGEIMDEQFYDDFVGNINLAARQVEGVKGTEKCLIRKHGMLFYVDLHLRVDGNMSVSKGHEIAHNVKKILKKEFPTLGDVLIHVEPL